MGMVKGTVHQLWLVHQLCLKSNTPFYLREPICITLLTLLHIYPLWLKHASTTGSQGRTIRFRSVSGVCCWIPCTVVVHMASMECYTFPLLVMRTEWLSIKHRATLGHAYRNTLGLILLQIRTVFTESPHTDCVHIICIHSLNHTASEWDSLIRN